MARTQAADYEQRRGEIVERAAELYAAHGFRGASVSDIAAACGISKSLVYHYFPSTRDILFEVMNSHVAELLERATAARQASGPPRARFEGLIGALLELYAGAANRQTVLLNELDQLSPEDRAKIVDAQRGVVDAMESILIDLRPELGKSDRRRAVTMLAFGMINWLHTWYDPSRAIKPPEIADLASALLLDGVERAKL